MPPSISTPGRVPASIDSAHPVTMEVTGRIDKRHIQGKVRGGGPLIEASCSSGSIRIR